VILSFESRLKFAHARRNLENVFVRAQCGGAELDGVPLLQIPCRSRACDAAP
jgi:hypothetical protein